ncbi:Glutamate receptor ionotropic, NMDA 3B [Aix galericulata]|nr:Glutamate receptor ionotropic, NMDA 3B [Aix galericulata]
MAGLGALWLLAAALGAAGGHPQPCRVPARAGPAVRLGALLPPAAPGRVRAALAGAAGGSGGSGGLGGAALPHNRSLELVAGAPAARDPGSLARWLCGALGGRGVAAVLAVPRSRRELLQLDFLAAALRVPFVSVLDTRGPLPFRPQVRASRPPLRAAGPRGGTPGRDPRLRPSSPRRPGSGPCSCPAPIAVLLCPPNLTASRLQSLPLSRLPPGSHLAPILSSPCCCSSPCLGAIPSSILAQASPHPSIIPVPSWAPVCPHPASIPAPILALSHLHPGPHPSSVPTQSQFPVQSSSPGSPVLPHPLSQPWSSPSRALGTCPEPPVPPSSAPLAQAQWPHSPVP